jgi:hypothetical protein
MGEITDLTPGDGLKAGFLTWLTDGSAFYIYSNERDASAFDLYRYSPEDYSRSLAYTNPGGFSLSALSDDGRWLALTRRVRSNRRQRSVPGRPQGARARSPS